MTKYEYLFDANDKLVHHSEAIRLNEYRLYPGDPLDYIYKQGDEREYFAKKIESTNVFGLIGIQETGIYGESPEHYNAKMKIVHEKKYFDTIFKQWVEFNNVKPEFYHDIKKRPDLSCYDENNNLVCCIEICWSNAKTEIDIEKLKQLNVPIIEIHLKNENRCKHLILPTLLESNRQALADINFKLQEFDQEQQQLETEYNRLADQLQEGSSRITTDIKYFEINFKGEVKRRLDKIDNWLQTRLKRFAVEDNADQKIKYIEREFKRIKNEGEKRDYRIGKLESKVKSIESKINQNRNTFDKIAEQSKIEWFRNSWMSYSPQNVVDEIKYWLS
jgi:DNA repair exonuclease SbcCD ATPase subunit